jgi:hypothetical protein
MSYCLGASCGLEQAAHGARVGELTFDAAMRRRPPDNGSLSAHLYIVKNRGVNTAPE